MPPFIWIRGRLWVVANWTEGMPEDAWLLLRPATEEENDNYLDRANFERVDDRRIHNLGLTLAGPSALTLTFEVKNVTNSVLSECYVGICTDNDIGNEAGIAANDRISGIVGQWYVIDGDSTYIDDLGYQWQEVEEPGTPPWLSEPSDWSASGSAQKRIKRRRGT